MTLILPRRRFLAGLVGLIAAPAVVKTSSLMKIVAPRPSFAIVDFSDAYGRSPMMDALPDMLRLSWEPIDGAIGYNVYSSIPVNTWRKFNRGSALA